MMLFLNLLALSALSYSSALVRPSHISLRKTILVHSLSPLNQDILSSCTALGGSVIWLKVWIQLAKSGRMDPRLSRKIIHCGSAPLFICLWPLYSSDGLASRAIASSIPLIQILRLVTAGIKSENNTSESNLTAEDVSQPITNDLVNAISRSGSNSEALGGPLLYTIMLFLGTLLFFRGSPIGVVAISQMAAGDGIADIVGRRYGSIKWPFSEKKSYAGSAAFVAGAFTTSTVLLAFLSVTGSLVGINVMNLLPQLLLISILCALVELVPIGDDNVTVPIAAAVLSWALL